MICINLYLFLGHQNAHLWKRNTIPSVVFVQFVGQSNWFLGFTSNCNAHLPRGSTAVCINRTISETPSSQLLTQKLQVQRSLSTPFGWSKVNESGLQPAGVRHSFEKLHRFPIWNQSTLGFQGKPTGRVKFNQYSACFSLSKIPLEAPAVQSVSARYL